MKALGFDFGQTLAELDYEFLQAAPARARRAPSMPGKRRARQQATPGTSTA